MRSLARVNRRTFLQTAAAGAAALAVPRTGAAAPARQDAVEVDFWNPGNDPLGGPIIVTLVDGFNASVGPQSGIEVKNNPVPGTNAYVKYTTAMSSGSSPDVIMTYGYDPVIPWIANGFVQPMDAAFQELGLKQEDFYPLAWDMMFFNGQIWGLPQEFDMVELFWNTDIHAGPPPTTIEELDALAAQYTTFDDDGNLVQAGVIPWAQGGFSPGGYGSWGTIWGARFYDHAQRKWTINRPENYAFLDWYLTYVELFGGREKADALISSIPRNLGYGDIFLYGRTAFAMEGEFIPLELVRLELTSLKYQIAHPPTVPGVTQGPTCMVDAANIFLVPINSEHPAEASVFVKYMVSNESLVAWSTPIGQMLPTKAAANDPGLLEALPWMKIFNETVEGGRVLPPPLSPQATVFSQAMSLAIDEVTYKKKTPAEALAEVESKVMAAVQAFQAQHPDWQGE